MPATHRRVTVGRPHRCASGDLAKADHAHSIRTPLLNDEHYVDDHALSQIVASLPALGADPTETVMVRVGDTERELAGCGDPQTMRMLLLQILTGRRVSEICMCEFDCLSPPTARAVEAAEGEQVARFHYAQTKIDRAPDTILVDTEVVAVIEEQQQAVRARFPDSAPRYLFPRRLGNQHGDKPVNRRVYARSLLRFSELIQVIDAKGRAIRLSQTHRFRHTRLTRLAELGLPVHVLQRYAGHANPTMSMHYVAQREEHAEQAFLATRKFKADGTAVTFSREDHDGMHLFDRADRFLPHGYCLLPPLQTCDKGNACLTCSVFVTDTSHLDTLQRQLDETNALIDRTTEQFQQRHGKPMPDDNVWLTQRTAERDALVKLIATMQTTPRTGLPGRGKPHFRARPDHDRHHQPPETSLVSDTRQQRIEVLKTAARRKSEEKTRSADAAIARLIKRGEPVTFQAVQREAGVSHAFLYNNTRLRARIEHQRRQHRPAPDPISIDDATDNNIVAALTAEIARLKAQHRAEVTALRTALEQAHGENLELRRQLQRRLPSQQPKTETDGHSLLQCTQRSDQR